MLINKNISPQEARNSFTDWYMYSNLIYGIQALGNNIFT